MASPSKTGARKPDRVAGRGVGSKSLAQELADVLEVCGRYEASFPGRAERTRIALSLSSGERLELEFAGQGAALSSTEELEDSGLRLAFKTTASPMSAPASIEDLGLGISAKAAAQSLMEQFPGDIKFTSGKRSLAQQAAAMAPNVLRNRRWVERTYRNSPQRAALQKWVDDHPGATTAASIAAGLESVMDTWTEAQLRSFSRHATGDAFDVKPVAGAKGEKIKRAIAKLPKLNWHTFEEGGLEIWHAQFDA